ncbi:MAG: hypothetical protein ACRDV1_03115 [Actinomycetes bacterium]|uniref:hypothetical protein n=1 Tax=Nocardioides sp. TaxID=35761 RepID=UPI003D6BF464
MGGDMGTLGDWSPAVRPQEVDLPDTLFTVADEMGHYLDEVALGVAPGAQLEVVSKRLAHLGV